MEEEKTLVESIDTFFGKLLKGPVILPCFMLLVLLAAAVILLAVKAATFIHLACLPYQPIYLACAHY
jgi:hypothetical protein